VPTSNSIAILGAGLLGRLLAYRLTQQGQSVVLYERDGPQAEHTAAYVAAAMLAPFAESAVSDRLVTQLGIASLMRWPAWLAELAQHTTTPVFFQQEGTVVVWHRQDKEEALRFCQRLDRAYFTEQGHDVRSLDLAQLTLLEPALVTRFMQGIYLPGEGQLDNRALLAALLEYLEKNHVPIHWHCAVDACDVVADMVIDCRGLGAKRDWNQKHRPTSLRGVRGEVIRIYAPDVYIQRPVRLLHPRYPLYIAPKPNHVYVIGATEIESEDVSEVSMRSALELLSATYSLHPGFGEARVLEMRAQCRPALADHLPKMTWDGTRCLSINGLYRHGYLIAPEMVEIAIDYLAHIQAGTLNSTWIAQHFWRQLIE